MSGLRDIRKLKFIGWKTMILGSCGHIYYNELFLAVVIVMKYKNKCTGVRVVQLLSAACLIF